MGLTKRMKKRRRPSVATMYTTHSLVEPCYVLFKKSSIGCDSHWMPHPIDTSLFPSTIHLEGRQGERLCVRLFMSAPDHEGRVTLVNASGGTDHITHAAAESVGGYLRNASRRLRVPAAEGGRGTRRRLEIVVSAPIVQHQQNLFSSAGVDPVSKLEDDAVNCKTEVALEMDDDDEWDDIDLLADGDLVAPPYVKPEHQTVATGVKLPLKSESDSAAIQQAAAVQPNVASIATKREHAEIDVDSNVPIEFQGMKPTLTSLSSSNSHPAVRSAVRREQDEEREMAKAKAKAEKISTVAFRLCQLMAVIQRGVRWMRATHHVRLLRQLAAFRRRSSAANDISVATRKRSRSDASVVQWQYPIREAVRAARKVFGEAAKATACPTLAPCWVTFAKDTVNNQTSSAIMVLIKALNANFTAIRPPSNASADAPTAAPTALEEVPLIGVLTSSMRRVCEPHERVELPMMIHMVLLFLSLAHASGMCARLVLTWTPYPVSDVAAPEVEHTELLTTTGRRKKTVSAPSSASKKTPSSSSQHMRVTYAWVEIWCPVRQSYVSVNPCADTTVTWGAPYTLSFCGDGSVVDVTPRYTSKYSSVFSNRIECEHLSPHYIWSDIPRDDSRGYLDILMQGYEAKTQESRRREQREQLQLDKLKYAEPVPHTLSALKAHPLYVTEEQVGRWEAIYPKDKTTIVGNVKGLVVYRRSAVVSLRSRDGWLREGRSLASASEVAYKVVAPPPSRPFGVPSHFFGVWQTVPFQPLPLRPDGTIEKHGNSSWYILLRGSAPPTGIVHLRHPQISRVARKMHVDYAVACVAFVKRQSAANRRGRWEAVIDGIVVPESKAAAVAHAYEEWVALEAIEAAARRRQRALKSWDHFITQRLAVDRLNRMYEEGERRRRNRKPQ